RDRGPCLTAGAHRSAAARPGAHRTWRGGVGMDATAFLDEFQAEAGEHLRALDMRLLELERDPAGQQPVREMFLSAHTLKGGAAMLGLDGVRELAHAMEDVLAFLRDQRRPLDAATADLLFRVVDRLRELTESAP